MNYEQALALVRSAINRQFGVDPADIPENMVALDVAGWDSFSNGLLMMAIEEFAGMPLPFDDLAAAENVGAMAAVVAAHA